MPFLTASPASLHLSMIACRSSLPFSTKWFGGKRTTSPRLLRRRSASTRNNSDSTSKPAVAKNAICQTILFIPFYPLNIPKVVTVLVALGRQRDHEDFAQVFALPSRLVVHWLQSTPQAAQRQAR